MMCIFFCSCVDAQTSRIPWERIDRSNQNSVCPFRIPAFLFFFVFVCVRRWRVVRAMSGDRGPPGCLDGGRPGCFLDGDYLCAGQTHLFLSLSLHLSFSMMMVVMMDGGGRSGDGGDGGRDDVRGGGRDEEGNGAGGGHLR